ncbi:MAG: hypothetical protein ACOYXR_13280 [Nitrospirota bacterium]
MMKRLIATWSFVLFAIVPAIGSAYAIEYGLEGSAAAYRWVEDFGGLRPEEFGPVVELGGYVSGMPYRLGGSPESATSLTLRGDVRLLLGRVNYDTFETDLNTNVTTPVSTTTTYVGATYEGSVGARGVRNIGYLEPFIGLGFRWWLRDVGGASGYPEVYRQIYGRVGVRTEHALGDKLKFRSTFSVDPVLWSREEVDLSGIAFMDTDFSPAVLVEGQRFTVKNGLKPGWTVEAGIRQGQLDITGFWRAVRLGESNRVICMESAQPQARRGCLQPESDQDVFGVRFGVAF